MYQNSYGRSRQLSFNSVLFTLQDGKTALEIAISNNHLKVLKALLENAVSVNKEDDVSIFLVLKVNEKFIFRSRRNLCRRGNQTTSLWVVS